MVCPHREPEVKMTHSFLDELLKPSDSWRSFLRSIEIVVLVVAAAVLMASLLYLVAYIAGIPAN